MSLAIFKYQLAITDEQVIAVPRGARFLSCQPQHGAPALWFLVDPDPSALAEAVRIHIYGTGHPVTHAGDELLGTVQIDGLVWHVFRCVN